MGRIDLNHLRGGHLKKRAFILELLDELKGERWYLAIDALTKKRIGKRKRKGALRQLLREKGYDPNV